MKFTFMSDINNSAFNIYFIGQSRYMLPVVVTFNDTIPKIFSHCLIAYTSLHKC